MNNVLQTIGLYSVLGLLTFVAGITIDNPMFWSLLALFWAGGKIEHMRGVSEGMAQCNDLVGKVNAELIKLKAVLDSAVERAEDEQHTEGSRHHNK